MYDLPKQSKILIIHQCQNHILSKTSQSFSCFSKLFISSSILYKNINCLDNHDTLVSVMKKRNCRLFVNYYRKEEIDFISFGRLIDDKLEYIKYKILDNHPFTSTGPLINSKNILYFKNVPITVHSLFTDLFYQPSQCIHLDSIQNVVIFERNDHIYNFHVKSVHDLSVIGPFLKLEILEESLINHNIRPKKKEKNVKVDNQRKTGKIYLNKQDLKGLRLKKGIFKE